jgi:hypothetical protein
LREPIEFILNEQLSALRSFLQVKWFQLSDHKDCWAICWEVRISNDCCWTFRN